MIIDLGMAADLMADTFAAIIRGVVATIDVDVFGNVSVKVFSGAMPALELPTPDP